MQCNLLKSLLVAFGKTYKIVKMNKYNHLHSARKVRKTVLLRVWTGRNRVASNFYYIYILFLFNKIYIYKVVLPCIRIVLLYLCSNFLKSRCVCISRPCIARGKMQDGSAALFWRRTCENKHKLSICPRTCPFSAENLACPCMLNYFNYLSRARPCITYLHRQCIYYR